MRRATADFFRNKPMRFMITFEPGGSYDIYARLAAAHWRSTCPDSRRSTCNHPGAGGLVGILHFAEKARGTAARSRSCRATWRSISGCGRRPTNTTRADQLDRHARDLSGHHVRRKPHRREDRGGPAADRDGGGLVGPDQRDLHHPTLLNALADTRFKIVSGYRGGPDVDLAVERGEVDGRMASWTLIKTQRAQWLRDKFVVIPFQAGITSHPELKDVPLIGSLAKTEEGRRIFEFQNPTPASAGASWRRQTAARARRGIARGVRQAMAADPEFRAEAERRGLDMTPARRAGARGDRRPHYRYAGGGTGDAEENSGFIRRHPPLLITTKRRIALLIDWHVHIHDPKFLGPAPTGRVPCR